MRGAEEKSAGSGVCLFQPGSLVWGDVAFFFLSGCVLTRGASILEEQGDVQLKQPLWMGRSTEVGCHLGQPLDPERGLRPDSASSDAKRSCLAA